MSRRPLNLVFIGLSLSSSWGNGHATTYRALLKGLAERGHTLTFLEREVPWYAAHRDLSAPEFCQLCFYDRVEDLTGHYAESLKRADAVIVGSYVPDGIAVIQAIASLKPAQLCFYDIDTPVTLAALTEGACVYLSRELIKHFDIYFSFTGGPALDQLERDYGARRAIALYCMVDPELYRPAAEPMRWDIGYLGTYSEDRQGGLKELLLEPARRLPERRFVVAGAQYPADVDWPVNVDRIEHVPPANHSRFNGSLGYALNLTRADMRRIGWSPSVRLFEAAACGTPIITDRWAGQDSIFPRDALRVADAAEDVVNLLMHDSPECRLSAATSAREIVLDRHTGLHRALEVERALDRDRRLQPSGSLSRKELHDVSTPA